MTLSFFSCFFIIILLFLPIYILYNIGSTKQNRVFIALLKMGVGAVFIGLVIYYAMKINNTFINVLLSLVAPLLATYAAILKKQPHRKYFFTPLLIANCVVLLLLVLPAHYALSGADNFFSAQYLLPLLPITYCSVAVTTGKGINAYANGLLNDGKLYYYLQANGATHNTSIGYLLRRAIEKATIMNLKPLCLVVSGTAPWVLCIMIMCGIGIGEALVAQVVCILLAFASSIVSLFICLTLSQKYTFDPYQQFKQ